ncbi:helix-turn-helix domain-containing protein [Prescottella defluvii]|uniref:AlbA family DNA-binding domain-containing protein n=1 Tax=Prescottella defluvii TaxID=1323361 RepID=UPI0038B67552
MTSPDLLSSPRTESELQSALTGGLLEETHYLDLKREISPGKSGSKGIGKDLAAFAVDGGMILIGVEENDDPRNCRHSPRNPSPNSARR